MIRADQGIRRFELMDGGVLIINPDYLVADLLGDPTLQLGFTQRCVKDDFHQCSIGWLRLNSRDAGERDVTWMLRTKVSAAKEVDDYSM
jgi:hypothetical protein